MGGGSRVSAMSRRGSGATAKLCWVEERTFAMVGVGEYEIQYEEGEIDDQIEREAGLKSRSSRWQILIHGTYKKGQHQRNDNEYAKRLPVRCRGFIMSGIACYYFPA